MSPLRVRYVDDAEQHWRAGRFSEAGQVLYEHIPQKYRPAWATTILTQTASSFAPIAEINHVLTLGSDPARWGEAHEALTPLRRVTLRSWELPRERSILLLAENTCKVIYNASGQPAPFDHDAGWRIPACLVEVVNQLRSSELAYQAWPLLTAPTPRLPVIPVAGLTFTPTRDRAAGPS
jgi:hypothetical protein